MRLFLLTFLLVLSFQTKAQKLLQKRVSLTVQNRAIKNVLADIENQGKFYFSYKSDLFNADSLVSVKAHHKPVDELLYQLLGESMQFKEINDYIIIQKTVPEKYHTLYSRLIDSENQESIDLASIYSKTSLISSLSDDDGYFKLRVREKQLPVHLTISRMGYYDTTLVFRGTVSDIKLIALRRKPFVLDEAVVTYSKNERRFFGRFFVSSKLRTHAQNINHFFVSLPYQISLVPGASTHGKLSSQVENKVSLNLVGGYTGGSKGVELAGVFNINRRDIRFFQAAGLFNTVLGHVNGVQLGGFANTVADSLRGLQVGGVFNTVNQNVTGIQMAGLYNFVDKSVKGVQISGAINQVKDTVTGAQLAGIFNSAKNLDGLQIGLINKAEHSTGVSIGLLNFIKNGKADISLATSEIVPVSLRIKTGQQRFYTMLALGFAPGQRVYDVGLGVGTEHRFNKKWFAQAEIGQFTLLSSSLENGQSYFRLNTELHYALSQRISVFAAPALSALRLNENVSQNESLFAYLKERTNIDPADKWKLWLGFQTGLSYRFKN